jgi:hypothetical protein
LGTVVPLSGGDDGGRGNNGAQQDRREQAVALCTDYTSRIVKDAGGRGARLERLKRTHRDGHKWRIEAYMKARWRNDSNPTRFTDCTVNSRGSNRVVAFRHDGLHQRPGGGGGAWAGGGGSGGSVRERCVSVR